MGSWHSANIDDGTATKPFLLSGMAEILPCSSKTYQKDSRCPSNIPSIACGQFAPLFQKSLCKLNTENGFLSPFSTKATFGSGGCLGIARAIAPRYVEKKTIDTPIRRRLLLFKIALPLAASATLTASVCSAISSLTSNESAKKMVPTILPNRVSVIKT